MTDPASPGPFPHVLTVVADPAAAPLTPALLARVREVAGGGAPTILSPGEAADIPLPSLPEMDAVRAALDFAPIDLLALPAAGRRKRLLIADMDSTIVTGETLDELADFAGLKAEVAAITRRSMNGELDFATALRERVGMLKGLPVAALEATWARVRLTEGARELVATMRAHGATTALVSGGFTFFTGRVAALIGFDLHRSNVLEHDGAVLTGTVAEPILDRDAKLTTLRALRAERGSRRRRRWRWATAPTIWRCCAKPASASRSTPSRWSRPRRARGWTTPGCARCCSPRATGRPRSSPAPSGGADPEVPRAQRRHGHASGAVR